MSCIAPNGSADQNLPREALLNDDSQQAMTDDIKPAKRKLDTDEYGHTKRLGLSSILAMISSGTIPEREDFTSHVEDTSSTVFTNDDVITTNNGPFMDTNLPANDVKPSVDLAHVVTEKTYDKVSASPETKHDSAELVAQSSDNASVSAAKSFINTIVNSDVPCDDLYNVRVHYLDFFTALKCIKLHDRYCNLPKDQRVYITHHYPPTKQQLARPAVKQVLEIRRKHTHLTGEYNLWYGYNLEYANSNASGRKSVKSETRLNVFTDSGYTLATVRKHFAPFCYYFAKGSCLNGSDCRYHHRVPTLFDNDIMPLEMDVFGRKRPAGEHRDAIGIGSRNNACRTIIVDGIPLVKTVDGYKDITDYVFCHFCIFGPIESVNIIKHRSLFNIKFAYRAACEFAFVALDGQELTIGSQSFVLTIKWAASSETELKTDVTASRLRYNAMKTLKLTKP